LMRVTVADPVPAVKPPAPLAEESRGT